MFKKNDFNLKKDFRKLLQLTDVQFQSRINTDQQRTIMLMWNKIVGESEFIAVARFQKQGYRLGIKIKTSTTKLGYKHEIVNIEEKSCVSKQSGIQTGDIILEVNGVNLLLLNYDQLALTLGGLPNNIQFVLWKKEGEGVYERTDHFDISSSDDHYHLVRDTEDNWRSSIRIIIQSSQIKSHGLLFINSEHGSRNSAHCVIRKIDKDGYFYDDQRICINDSILKLNGKDLQDYSDRAMQKIFSGNKRCAYFIEVRKYQWNGFSSDLTSISGSKMSLPNSSKDSLKRNQSFRSASSLLSPKSFLKSMRNTTREKQSPTKEKPKSESIYFPVNEYDTISISLSPSDDLKIYLVDVQEAGNRKCIICGFHPDSTLRKKFHFKDQIIKINDENTMTMSSKDVGLVLKKFYHQKCPLTISVLRKSKGGLVKSEDNLIVASDMLTTESETQSSINEESCQSMQNVCHDGDIFHVTLCKENNSFGLRITDQNGPTITEITVGSVAHKSGLVLVDDKIIKINDIYVLDKEQTFVLTMIRSCGERMDIELLRKSSHSSSDIQFLENQTYFSGQSLNFNPSNQCYDSKHSVFLPLPPVPENELNKDSYNKQK